MPRRRKTAKRLAYTEYMNSDAWRSKRNLLLTLCPRCCACQSSKELQCHHLTYERFGAERLDDLMVLCKKCHKKSHVLWRTIPKNIPIEVIRISTLEFLKINKFVSREEVKAIRLLIIKNAMSSQFVDILQQELEAFLKKRKIP
jgi:hypothetical protein